MPPTNLSYLKQLTDDFGVWEHAKETQINLDEGYAMDDAARALIVYLEHKEFKEAQVCWNFIKYSFQNGHGQFDSAREAEAPVISHDMAGLSLWALAEAMHRDFQPEESHKLYDSIFQQFASKFSLLRPLSYALISTCLLSDSSRSEELVNKLSDMFNQDLNWFEPKLTYANPLPLIAILHYLQAFPGSSLEVELLKIWQAGLLTLEKYTYIGLIPAPVGNRIWQTVGDDCRDVYGQQPVDAALAVIMYVLAYQRFLKEELVASAKNWHSWFHGNNIWRASLINETGACADGLDETGVSINHGAESTIMYLLAQIYLKRTGYPSSSSSFMTISPSGPVS